MKLLPRILNRIAFVRAEFTSADECRTEVFMWRSGILSPTGRATAKNALAVLVVCGQGVVTKPEGCQVVARVEADPETFLWSSAGGATSFVRRERLQSVLAVLAADTLLLGGALHWWWAAPLAVLLPGLAVGVVESTQARNKLSRNATFLLTIAALAALIFFVALLLHLNIDIR